MHIFLIAAMSVDGFIARNNHEPSTAWTSKEDSAWFHRRTKEAGVVVMGRTSYETIPQQYRPLKDRLSIVYTSQSESELDEISDQEWRTQLSPALLVERLGADGHKELAIAGGKRVYSDWIRSGLIQTLYLTVEPVLFGSGVKLFDSDVTGALSLADSHKLSEHTQVYEYTIKYA